MKYKIYFKGSQCKIPGFTFNLVGQQHHERHEWPEDLTELEFSVDVENEELEFHLSNLSDRAQYLLDNDLLGLGIFVDECTRWMGHNLLGAKTRENHPTRRCVQCFRIYGTSGTINLNTISSWSNNKTLSRTLHFVAGAGDIEQDPPKDYVYETVYIGIGRFNTNDNGGFRPFRISGPIEIEYER